MEKGENRKEKSLSTTGATEKLSIYWRGIKRKISKIKEKEGGDVREQANIGSVKKPVTAKLASRGA